jgi:hypothetical protein
MYEGLLEGWTETCSAVKIAGQHLLVSVSEIVEVRVT